MAHIKLIVETYILRVHSATFALLAVKYFFLLLATCYNPMEILHCVQNDVLTGGLIRDEGWRNVELVNCWIVESSCSISDIIVFTAPLNFSFPKISKCSMAYIKLIVETYILRVHSETFALLAVKFYLSAFGCQLLSLVDSSMRSEWRSNWELV